MEPLHSFHIPVMGLAYTIDSPIKVARFGIPSVISIIEDRLIETMRKYYYPFINREYKPINTGEPDCRARRITDYLNLVNSIVQQQVTKLKTSAFQAGSDIAKYFEMLPCENKLRQLYCLMPQMKSGEKLSVEKFLRERIAPGTIDVNIMTKVDKNNPGPNGEVIEDSSDAVAALRGYAMSDLDNSSVVFSAGMNPRLFNYLEKLEAFQPAGPGQFRKRVVIKVSDYRSALIQGKYLAKKGVWVSEFRIESGLNCGGHAFATDGYLMGPILEEFKSNREALVSALQENYNTALREKGKKTYDTPHPVRISVQGGIGTHEEDVFLKRHYELTSTGWGTPFLLCPEATTVDSETLERLRRAGESDVELSRNSPLGVRFYNLKGSSGEREKQQRVEVGRPGSPCTEKHLVSNTEFTSEPICTASSRYQKLKIAQLQSLNLEESEYQRRYDDVVSKECLCVGLSNAASRQYGVPFAGKRQTGITVCPGPNIAYFSTIATLQEMVGHIYGRINLLAHPAERPHMFIKELRLYIAYLREQIDEATSQKQIQYCTRFANNLLDGIGYYNTLSTTLHMEDSFSRDLAPCESDVRKILKLLNEHVLERPAPIQLRSA